MAMMINVETTEGGRLALAVEGNARRLACDARFLFESARYPSSAALSILAIEEVGKWSMLRGAAKDISSVARRHVDKQVAASTMCLADDVWEAIQARLSEHGLEMKHVSEISEERRAFVQGPAYASWYAGVLERTELKDRIAGVLSASPSGALLREARDGTLQRLKNQSFYADVDSDTPAALAWRNFERSDAERLLTQAEKALAQILKLSAEKSPGSTRPS